MDGSINILGSLLTVFVLFMEGGGHNSRASLGEDEKDDDENHACGHSAQLQLADVSTRENLGDEEVIHVEQGVEREGEEEERAPPLAVRGVVVPEQNAGQRCEDCDTQQVVQRCDSQQQGKQHQGRDHGDLQVVYHGPQCSTLGPTSEWYVFQPPAKNHQSASNQHQKCSFSP